MLQNIHIFNSDFVQAYKLLKMLKFCNILEMKLIIYIVEHVHEF